MQLEKIKHVALDMDGTIYLGDTLFPYTIDFLDKLKRMGISYSFLTNNPSKSIEDYLKKLARMGIHATEEEIYNTTVATIDYIKAHYPEARRLFLLGTPSMISQFEAAGFTSCEDTPEDVPDIVVAAFDMTLTYKRLCRAAWWISRGLPYIATNPDRVCPTMLIGIQQQRGLKPEEILMVGDRIYTDIAMAFNAGAMGCLVLSGETTMEVAQAAEHQPDLIVDSIEVLGNMLQQIHDR